MTRIATGESARISEVYGFAVDSVVVERSEMI